MKTSITVQTSDGKTIYWPDENHGRLAPAAVCSVASRIVELRNYLKRAKAEGSTFSDELERLIATPISFEAEFLSGKIERVHAAIVEQAGRFVVYRDPTAESAPVVLGYKGNDHTAEPKVDPAVHPLSNPNLLVTDALNPNYSLDEYNLQKLDEWLATKDLGKFTGSMGGRFTFSFCPTNLGVIVKCTDSMEAQDTVDLTDYESF